MNAIASLLLPVTLVTSGLLAQALPQDRPIVQNQRGPATAPTGLTLPSGPSRVLFDRADDGAVWALGATWKGRFDGSAFAYVPFFGSQAPRNFPVEFAVRSVTVGGAALPLAAGEPAVADDRVRIARGGMTETYDLSLSQVEQSFVFDALPNRGEIAVEIGVSSELAGAARDGGVRFGNEHGAVDYTKAVAVDAAGRRLTLPITWRGDAITLAIPADFVAGAQLPLVLDPIITTSPILVPANANQTNADVATLRDPERIAITWQRTWSAIDEDCYIAVYDNAWNVVTGPFAVDFTVENWLMPRVASNQSSSTFLVVGQVNSGANYWVAGRTLTTASTLSGKFDIERAGVIGNPGNTLEPDVGGDPYPIAPSYFCVVFTKEVTATDKDVCCKMVLPNGTLLSPTPTRLSTVSNTLGVVEQSPSISNSNASGDWIVAWNYLWQSAPFDTDVRAAAVLWNGTVTTPDFIVAGSLDNESRPSASSPADVGAGALRHLVAWDQYTTTGAQADIQCRTLTTAGALDPLFNLSAASAGGVYQSRDQIQPRVDSDGARFVVAYDEFDGAAFNYFTIVDTVAAPSPNGVLGAMRVEESHVPTSWYGARLSAFRGADFVATSRYALAGHSTFAPNYVAAMLYGGYTLGTTFSVFASQCGALPISYSGNPTVGNSVTISVPNTGVSGTVFGYPGYFPLAGLLANCNCILGVQNGLLSSNPLTFTIPNNAAFVGVTLSVQGYSAGGTSCLSILDLSDTVDFTIR
jgi:hypothetical protein